MEQLSITCLFLPGKHCMIAGYAVGVLVGLNKRL